MGEKDLVQEVSNNEVFKEGVVEDISSDEQNSLDSNKMRWRAVQEDEHFVTQQVIPEHQIHPGGNSNHSVFGEHTNLSKPPGFEKWINIEGDKVTNSGSFSATSKSKVRIGSNKAVNISKVQKNEIAAEAISRFIEVGTKLGYGMSTVSENMEAIIKQMGEKLVDK